MLSKIILTALSATLLLSTGSTSFAASKKRPAHRPAATVSVPAERDHPYSAYARGPYSAYARDGSVRTFHAPRQVREPDYFGYATGGDNG
jgi:hypothetical protein